MADFTSEERRKFSWQYITAGVSEGLNKAAIIDILQSNQISYRRADMLRDIDLARAGVEQREENSFLPSSHWVDIEEESTRTVNTLSAGIAQVSILARNPETSEIVEHHWGVHLAENTSIEDILAAAREQWEEYGSKQEQSTPYEYVSSQYIETWKSSLI
jgi:hypothetical protein